MLRGALEQGSENGGAMVVGPPSARAELHVAAAPAQSRELLALHLLPDARWLEEEAIRWIRAKGHRKDHTDSAHQPMVQSTSF